MSPEIALKILVVAVAIFIFIGLIKIGFILSYKFDSKESNEADIPNVVRPSYQINTYTSSYPFAETSTSEECKHDWSPEDSVYNFKNHPYTLDLWLQCTKCGATKTQDPTEYLKERGKL